MRHRLYWVLPDLDSARRTADDLLLARVEDRRMHFLGLRGTPLGELHEASVFQKSDIRHGAGIGLLLGAGLGVAAAAVISVFPIPLARTGPEHLLALVAVSVAFGVWVASMIGASVPNTRLRRFDGELRRGRILLILDVPARRVDEIRAILARSHPEASWGGEDPSVPAFP